MNILYIWDGDYPWDIRVAKVTTSLQVNKYNICIVCRNIKRSPLVDSYGGVTIYRLPYLPKWFGNLNNAFTFPAFFNPVWLWKIYQVARMNRCDCIVVRDLPMALAGLVVAKILKIPCVLDMAECYPEMLRCTWKFEGISIKNILVRNPWAADLVERIVMKRITHVWVMIEESRDRLLRMGVDKNKISIVSNTPILRNLVISKSFDKKENIYRMVYVGLINPSRGLDTVIDAVSFYSKKNYNFHFDIIGTGKAEKKLKEKVKEMKLNHFVTFWGWVQNENIPNLIANADVGIVPHHDCEHWANTIPNKLFDYMASSKPVIVSNVAPMRRIVEMIGCGMVYEDYNPEQLCSVISELSNPHVRAEFATKGRSAILEQYNWKNEEKVMFDSLEKIKKQVG